MNSRWSYYPAIGIEGWAMKHVTCRTSIYEVMHVTVYDVSHFLFASWYWQTYSARTCSGRSGVSRWYVAVWFHHRPSNDYVVGNQLPHPVYMCSQWKDVNGANGKPVRSRLLRNHVHKPIVSHCKSANIGMLAAVWCTQKHDIERARATVPIIERRFIDLALSREWTTRSISIYNL